MTAWNRIEALNVFSTALPVCLHCYRLALCGAIALTFSLFADPQASGLEIYAASIFGPDVSDPDPSLSGILKVDLDTGDVSSFIPEIYNGFSPEFAFITDVAVDPTNGDIYASTLLGSIMRFDDTGTPIASTINGLPAGTFAFLTNTISFGDGYSTLHFDDDGTLLAGTFFGAVTSFDTSDGSVISDPTLNIGPISGLDRAPSGELILTAGGNPETGTPSSVYQYDNGSLTTLVSDMATPGVLSGSNPTIVEAAGDYDGSGVVDQDDYDVWEAAYGTSSLAADGNYDGVVDAADYTVWRDNVGEQTSILIADLHANSILSFNLDGSGGEVFAEIPLEFADPLPPSASSSNSPSEILVTPEGTLLVSLLGYTQRPDNSGAILEYDLDGNLIQTLTVNTNAGTLPPISGIDYVPFVTVGPSTSVPEPASLLLVMSLLACQRTQHRRS